MSVSLVDSIVCNVPHVKYRLSDEYLPYLVIPPPEGVRLGKLNIKWEICVQIASVVIVVLSTKHNMHCLCCLYPLETHYLVILKYRFFIVFIYLLFLLEKCWYLKFNYFLMWEPPWQIDYTANHQTSLTGVCHWVRGLSLTDQGLSLSLGSVTDLPGSVTESGLSLSQGSVTESGVCHWLTGLSLTD